MTLTVENTTQNSLEHPNIFIDASGLPLKIYVDITGIPRRVRLIRALRRGPMKNSGAEICHAPADASLFLINSSRASGKRILRDWGTDADVVLEYSWIQQSLFAGRALLREDNWGGLQAIDDDAPIPSDEEDNGDDGQADERQSGKVHGPPSTPSKQVHGTSRNSVNDLVHRLSMSAQGTSAQLSRDQAISISEEDIPHDPVLAITGFVNNAITLSRQHNIDTTPLETFLAALPLPDPSPQPPSPLHHASPTPNSAPGRTSQDPLSRPCDRSLVPVSQLSHPLPEPSLQHYNPPQELSSQSFEPSQERQDTLVDSSSILPYSQDKDAEAIIGSVGDDASGPYPDEDEIVFLDPVFSGDNGTASSPMQPPPLSYSQRVNLASSSHTARISTPPAERPELYKLFTIEPDHQLSFYVADLYYSPEVVRAIEKHGGKITSHIAAATFAILNPKLPSFELSYTQALAYQTPVIQASYVHDCIQAGQLLEYEDYKSDEVQPSKKRERPRTCDDGESPQKKPRTSSNLLELPGIGDISESDLDEILASVGGSMPNTVSVQEPPNSSQAATRFRFTAGEWDHCWRLVRQLLEADQTIGVHRASDQLHKQLRNHSQASWYRALLRKKGMFDSIKDDVVAMRRAKDNLGLTQWVA
ncbi:hypothetical protein HETIRDRAFT_426852 [Heterobasidion irregulare TC 32-1]|uniref:BRCT domain-containing protein n=1 Tax=Heterobasidion irregulare (strain TC 32-1) TaxID=747525 RepID=W4K6H4_HETIT|nr:uncharacterized protein HETIRDRAFT_426852 [Heterobasidion irregulare TC 32-1]ETW81427.1 hypothetical protein HETIRDRAFT_426852 [Heterobasidion irregulare TC 32-1]